MTNREYIIAALSGKFDDGGATEEAVTYYHVECPYYEGDDRSHCDGSGTKINRETCSDCKAEWLDDEVDYQSIGSTISNQPKVGEWIPCSERLPENAQHKGAFCPKYQVMTKYGITEGWYNPDLESWYILVWFMSEDFREYNINIKRGDIPKRLRVPKGIVTAWQPSPEPWEGGQK